MKCDKCCKDFPENEIDLSHDIPCYLFINHQTRNERKNIADKFPRHNLCKDCHKKYEYGLNVSLKSMAFKYSKLFFGEVQND